MKLLASFVLLSVMVLFCNACVSRTVTVEPQYRGVSSGKKSSLGSDPKSQTVEKKIVWIWQDEYRNAK